MKAQTPTVIALLADALHKYGAHPLEACEPDRCTCGLDEALCFASQATQLRLTEEDVRRVEALARTHGWATCETPMKGDEATAVARQAES